jgi:hypothetical protein
MCLSLSPSSHALHLQQSKQKKSAFESPTLRCLKRPPHQLQATFSSCANTTSKLPMRLPPPGFTFQPFGGFRSKTDCTHNSNQTSSCKITKLRRMVLSAWQTAWLLLLVTVARGTSVGPNLKGCGASFDDACHNSAPLLPIFLKVPVPIFFLFYLLSF